MFPMKVQVVSILGCVAIRSPFSPLNAAVKSAKAARHYLNEQAHCVPIKLYLQEQADF